MSVNIPNYQNGIPQGGLNKALYILGEVFGVKTPVYVANAWIDAPSKMPVGYELPAVQEVELPKFEGVEILPIEDSEIKSVFGTPVFGDITFEGGSYNRWNKYTGAIEKEKFRTYTLPYSCLVDFSRQNNIITTPVLGGNGTVKEIYGIGDWNINIRGIAFNGGKGKSAGRDENDAHRIIEDLIMRSEICDSIEVSGDVFLRKGISNIVIKSIDVQPIEAKWNVIPFQIQAISDEPIELTI